MGPELVGRAGVAEEPSTMENEQLPLAALTRTGVPPVQLRYPPGTCVLP